MSLGENLQFLRKRNNITQEQLAEKLDVSRQSISKWESDSTYPEMDKLLQLCQMFHCTMDDMVQNDISTLYTEDKTEYDKHMNMFSKSTAFAIGLIFFGLSVQMFFTSIGINDSLTTIVFLIFIIIAVAILIVMGFQHSDFEKKNPYIENFYTEKEIDHFNKKFSVMVACGIVLILIGILLTNLTDIVSAETMKKMNFDFEEFLVALLFLFSTAAVTILVYAGLQKDKYSIEEYNQNHDINSNVYRKNKITGTVCACIMMAASIIYLIFGFFFNKWGMPYILIFVLFGIMCGIVSVIINFKYKNKD